MMLNGVADGRESSSLLRCAGSVAASQCSSTEFQCDDGTCIDSALRCDRQYHCPDGTDEFDCRTSSLLLSTHLYSDCCLPL